MKPMHKKTLIIASLLVTLGLVSGVGYFVWPQPDTPSQETNLSALDQITQETVEISIDSITSVLSQDTVEASDFIVIIENYNETVRSINQTLAQPTITSDFSLQTTLFSQIDQLTDLRLEIRTLNPAETGKDAQWLATLEEQITGYELIKTGLQNSNPDQLREAQRIILDTQAVLNN